MAASLTDLTRRMSGMVDDLLAIAVATSGGRSLLKIAPVSAASLLKRAAGAARPLFADQGIANLLDNALKFTARQGNVVLRAKAGEGDRRGAGLGLAICHSIVEAHGGGIWAEPEPGKRVRICFTLPLAGVSSPAGAA